MLFAYPYICSVITELERCTAFPRLSSSASLAGFDPEFDAEWQQPLL